MMNRLEKLLQFCAKHPWFGLLLFCFTYGMGHLFIDVIRTVFNICE